MNVEPKYPDLSSFLPSAPTDDRDMSQMIRMEKIGEIEKFFTDEIKERERLYKKFKMWSFGLRCADNAVIFLSVLGSASGIGTLASGIGIPISIGLGSIVLGMSFIQIGLRKGQKKNSLRVIKHDQIKLLAESKLDSVISEISKAVENGVIDDKEFQNILEEKKKYLVFKHQIRVENRNKVKELNGIERQELINQGRKEEREDLAKKLKSV